MRVLAVTNIFPTPRFPASGTFVEQQIQSLRQTGLEVDVLVIDRAQQGPTSYLGVAKRVRDQVLSQRSDLLHVMYGGVLADKVTKAIVDRPVVVSFCGSDLLGVPTSPLLERAMASYGVRASHKAAARATAIVVKSRVLQAALPASVASDKVWVVSNGVDFQRFRPLDRVASRAELDWRPDGFHVLFPSHAGHSIKRIELATSALAVLRNSGVPAELHQLHSVPHAKMPVWLNACDVVILTSQHEGSPNIIKEALACDRPVVSVDVGDVRERIERVVGCYLAEAKAADLAAKLRMVYSGVRRIEGRSTIQELSLERVAFQLSGLYEEVLLRHRSKQSRLSA